ncbi:unnamed protein product [Arabis nemorensis]|uniref:DDE Tnp4 domain-containing protein n=1 Tax=Arabis nemorensis TaxID=586526 RepID=A0A565BAE0_9BRAS|nr:unnamed protein product [Arabis nemorensis]
MVKPELTVPAKISESTRIVLELPMVHISLQWCQLKKRYPFATEKGDISQNVLAACNFDLEFMYVLSGWEGLAHDSKVLSDALTKNTNRLPVPEALYRSVRYHLQEYSGQNSQPTNEKELFNYRRAS